MQVDNGGSSSFNPMPASQAAEIMINGMVKDKYHILVGSDAKTMYFISRPSLKFATNFITKQMWSLLGG